MRDEENKGIRHPVNNKTRYGKYETLAKRHFAGVTEKRNNNTRYGMNKTIARKAAYRLSPEKRKERAAGLWKISIPTIR